MSAQAHVLRITVVQPASTRLAPCAYLQRIMLGFATRVGVRGAATNSQLVQRASMTVIVLHPEFLWGLLEVSTLICY